MRWKLALLALGLLWLPASAAGQQRRGAIDATHRDNSNPIVLAFEGEASPSRSETAAAWDDGSTFNLPESLLAGHSVAAGSGIHGADTSFEGTLCEPCECRDSSWSCCRPSDRCSSRRTQFTAGTWLGSVSGHLQTPTGGEAGTTSSHRPTADEIGLDGASWMPTIDARLDIDTGHELHINYVHIDRSGDDVLDETLISNGLTFPAGSDVHGNMGLDTVRIGYRPTWWERPLFGGTVVPEVGVGVTAFEYELSSVAADEHFGRDYDVGFYYVGLLYEQPLGERFQWELDVAGSGGVNHVSFVDGEIRAVYQITSRRRWNASAVVGWRGMWFRRHDGQVDEQNDPNLRLGGFSDDPWTGFTLGIRVGL